MTSSGGEGRTIQFQSTSDTVEIAAGRICGVNSSGLIIATTVLSVDIPIIGVSGSKVASRDTASSEDIAIQMEGVASVPKHTDLSIAAGAILQVTAATTTVGTGSGSTCLMATTATTIAGAYLTLGRAAAAATTSDANVLVKLGIRS